MKITVLISTRDRCKKLAAALRALDETYVPPGVSVDVLVIDNGSADATADVCAKFAQVAKVGFCYIYESKRGKSNALNSGLSQSDSDVVAFTDDDCLVDKNWIVGIAREFANDTDLSILGGCSRLFDAKDKPLSISKNFTRTTVRRDDTRRERSDIELIV